MEGKRPPAHEPPSGTEIAMELATWGTGLGVITFALFPFLIPGLAILALGLLPLLPLLVLLPLVALPVWLVRAVRRRVRRRRASRTAPEGAGAIGRPVSNPRV